MEHITIDEMLYFLQIKELTISNKKLVNDFNQHIYQCEQCRKKYAELCETVETIEKSVNFDNEKVRLLQACFKMTDKTNSEIITIFKNIIKNLATEISVVIESLTKISTSNLLSGFSFYHPVPVRLVKSTNPTENIEVTDILIDDKYNRIGMSQDGTLSLRFQKNICGENQIVFLVPENVEQEVLVAHSKAGSDGLTRVEFFDMIPGNYKIII